MEHSDVLQTTARKANKGSLETQVFIGSASSPVPRRSSTSTGRSASKHGVKDDTASTVVSKSHINSLVSINRLPIELFTHIIRLTGSLKFDVLREYIPYTWVCHRWRSVLIHIANFWTSIRLYFKKKPINPFINEILARSDTAKLDVGICVTSTQSISILHEFFVKESSRIDTLYLELNIDDPDLVGLIFDGKQFPSLRQAMYYWSRTPTVNALFTIFNSNCLETFQCDLRDIPMKTIIQLGPALGHIRKLSLDIHSATILQFVLDSLHDNSKLQYLNLDTNIFPRPQLSSQIFLPELQFLSLTDVSVLHGIRAPKLISLDASWSSIPLPSKVPALEDYDFLSIHYLHIFCLGGIPHSILGLNESIRSLYMSPVKANDFWQIFFLIRDMEKRLDKKNILFDTWPRGYFRFEFLLIKPFSQAWEFASTSILPRMTGVLELCIASESLLKEKIFHIDETLAQFPVLERLTVLHGGILKELIRLLCNTSLCPRLKRLSYFASSPGPTIREELESLAEQVGEQLTECVQLRRKVYGDEVLTYVSLGMFPPLPDTWLKTLQMMGTTVETEKDIESIMGMVKDSSDPLEFLELEEFSDEGF